MNKGLSNKGTKTGPEAMFRRKRTPLGISKGLPLADRKSITKGKMA